MPDNEDVVKCPLCQGHGELRQLELAERLKSRDWKLLVDRYLTTSAQPAKLAGFCLDAVPQRLKPVLEQLA